MQVLVATMGALTIAYARRPYVCGPNISLRCLAYALPLSLLSWVVIIFGIVVIAGRLHAL